MSKSRYKIGLFTTLACLSLVVGCSGGSDKSSAPVVAQPIPVETPFDYQATIDNAISETIPGIALFVEKEGLTFLGTAGVTNTDTLEPMQSYHVMPTGSAGKKLTSLLAVLLEQEGLLNLDDRINTFLDIEILEQIENSDTMTIRQLLNHTAGVFDYLDDTNDNAFYNAVLSSDPTALKLDRYALSFALNKPAYSLPGEAFNYSNTGYLLVGLIIDKVLGEHHSVAVRHRIFDQLGMNESFYGGIEKERGEIISGYFKDETVGVLDTKPFFEYIGVADAPLRANVEDLALLLKNLVAEESVFSDDVQARFFDDNSVVQVDATTEYGLGIFKENVNGKTIYHHGGVEPGYTTANIFIKDSQTSITAFFNCGLTAECEAQTDKVIQIILENELK